MINELKWQQIWARTCPKTLPNGLTMSSHLPVGIHQNKGFIMRALAKATGFKRWNYGGQHIATTVPQQSRLGSSAGSKQLKLPYTSINNPRMMQTCQNVRMFFPRLSSNLMFNSWVRHAYHTYGKCRKMSEQCKTHSCRVLQGVAGFAKGYWTSTASSRNPITKAVFVWLNQWQQVKNVTPNAISYIKGSNMWLKTVGSTIFAMVSLFDMVETPHVPPESQGHAVLFHGLRNTGWSNHWHHTLTWHQIGNGQLQRSKNQRQSWNKNGCVFSFWPFGPPQGSKKKCKCVQRCQPQTSYLSKCVPIDAWHRCFDICWLARLVKRDHFWWNDFWMATGPLGLACPQKNYSGYFTWYFSGCNDVMENIIS